MRVGRRLTRSKTANGAESDIPPRAARSSDTSRAAAGMGAITAVSRIIGLARVFVVAAVLGTSPLGDAFQSANTLSNVLFELLAAGALSAVLVPTFVEFLDRNDQAGAERIAGGVLGTALIVMGVVTIIGIAASPLLARLLTLDIDDPEIASDQRFLVMFLLWFFVPQLLLYAFGTVSMGVLYAKRKFAVTAAAPIGNTVVMVVFLLIFWQVADPAHMESLDLTLGERFLLVAAGTGGVLALSGILYVACLRSEFRLRPRWPGRDRRVVAVIKHSGWGATLNSAAGLLLGTAIVAGAGVEGGVVAYQSAWVIFYAPYAVLAQPILTTILPEMATEARQTTVQSGHSTVAASLRWALERMALLVLPMSAAMIALAGPTMAAIAPGNVDSDLVAAAVAGFGVGLYPYSAFLLLARGYYAVGNSRTPGIVALASAFAGMVVMTLTAIFLDGTTRIAMLGVGHSAAYTVGAVVLYVGLSRQLNQRLRPGAITRVVVISTVVGVAAWLFNLAVLSDDPDRLDYIFVVAIAGVVGLALVIGAYRVFRVQSALSVRSSEAPPENTASKR